MAPAICVNGLTKRFPTLDEPRDYILAVDGVTVSVEEHETLAIVGPTGAGKSTLLRLIAGLEEPTSGDIYIDGERVNGLPARSRNVGLISHGYALFEHMTVVENIGFGLKVKGTSRKRCRQRAEELVRLFGLEGLEGRRPSQLSGAQQHRVALARAVAPAPRLLLLDDPFGAVDASMRQRLRADTRRLAQELKVPVILVTRNLREAVELGDRVAIMNSGRIQRVDSPQNFSDHRVNGLMAEFTGRATRPSPHANPDRGRVGRHSRPYLPVRPRKALNGKAPLENGGFSEMASSSFLGLTVRLKVQLKDGHLITQTMPARTADDHDLEADTPMRLTSESDRAFPSNGHV